MNSALNVTANRPLEGSVALVRCAAAMGSFGSGASSLHQGLPTVYPLDSSEDQMHPGEGSA